MTPREETLKWPAGAAPGVGIGKARTVGKIRVPQGYCC